MRGHGTKMAVCKARREPFPETELPEFLLTFYEWYKFVNNPKCFLRIGLIHFSHESFRFNPKCKFVSLSLWYTWAFLHIHINSNHKPSWLSYCYPECHYVLRCVDTFQDPLQALCINEVFQNCLHPHWHIRAQGHSVYHHCLGHGLSHPGVLLVSPQLGRRCFTSRAPSLL